MIVPATLHFIHPVATGGGEGWMQREREKHTHRHTYPYNHAQGINNSWIFNLSAPGKHPRWLLKQLLRPRWKMPVIIYLIRISPQSKELRFRSNVNKGSYLESPSSFSLRQKTMGIHSSPLYYSWGKLPITASELLWIRGFEISWN